MSIRMSVRKALHGARGRPRFGLALLALTIQATLGLQAAAAGLEAPEIGSQAPAFSLPGAGDTAKVGLAGSLEGNKAAVVIFIATKCPYSNAYNERMAQLGREYAKKEVAFIGINSNKTEPAADVALHAREHDFPFPVLKDDGNKVADAYGATRTPEVYVMDAMGKLVYHGRIDENYEEPDQVKSPDLRNALDALLAGKKVPRAKTKAFGCTIKR